MNSKQRAELRAQANGIDTILQIGKGGITANVLKQIDDALAARELIKIRVLENSEFTARDACAEICASIEAEPVQCIGTKIVLFRQKKDDKTVKR